MKNKSLLLGFLLLFLTQNSIAQEQEHDAKQELVSLFRAWRSFEIPPLQNGVPDYSEEAFDLRWNTFLELKTTLRRIAKR